MPATNPPAPMNGAAWLSLIRKLAIWGVFAGVLYLLRGFFLLIFLTFVIGYSAEQLVQFLEKRFPRVSRSILVISVFLGSIAAFAGLGVILVPAIEAEAAHVNSKFPLYKDQIIAKYSDFEKSWPAFADQVQFAVGRADALRRQLFGEGAASLPASGPAGDATLAMAERDISFAAELLLSYVRSALAAIFTFLLAWFFAFLILLDLADIRREIERLQSSRVGWLYREVRSSVVEFSASVGWILEAQIIISAINTILTIAGLWILGVPSLLLMGVILFFCGLVPFLGALVPLAPICFIAFAEGGFSLFIKCVAFIAVERIFVGYVVEPKIFGSRFHMNSVFVLVILLVGYKIAGLWGVVLGLPVAYTILRPRNNVEIALDTTV